MRWCHRLVSGNISAIRKQIISSFAPTKNKHTVLSRIASTRNIAIAIIDHIANRRDRITAPAIIAF